MCGDLRREGIVDGEAPLPTGQPCERLRRVPGVLPSCLLARRDNKEEVGNQCNEHQDSRSDAADEDAKQPPQDDRAFRRGPGRRSARAKLPILPGQFRGMESRAVAGAIFDHDATLCVGATPVEFGDGFLQTDGGRDGSGVIGVHRKTEKVRIALANVIKLASWRGYADGEWQPQR
jgi:hypothetical protein